ncbi:peptidase S28 [Cylindrobasidium torrendii FP15055 ss-10]|uniref:Peptidase S28 n=1 Tax=Cylindrobasidium torrendii FP15055 ss-10 TaxID=1314674 RepID=A0A0D7BUX2_9AGAR|nr:peptidase S28 [Cylindrobasidium torrendii FP15055 ss-10]
MPPAPMPPKVELPDQTDALFRADIPPYNTTYYFEQLVDHNDPSKGTFSQRYWHTWEFYEAGGPIILMTPGEGNADGYEAYLTNKTINGLIAQQEGGATIVLEHRFYGFSNPLPDLTPESLKLHTIQQAIDDLEYFAYNVELAMPNGTEVTPDKAPWILIGGSYAGALTSWTMVNKPGLFWAGYSSSGVVEAITDFWKYFEPIRKNMPSNCSADVAAVIAHVDEVFSGNDTAAIDGLKANWGLGGLTHLDDVAGALRNNLWDWQSLNPVSPPNATFYKFCNALETKDGEVSGEEGWGLDHALNAWGTFWNESYYELYCGDSDAESCFGSYNASAEIFTDTSVDNAGRSWTWIVCNDVGYYQDGPPKDVELKNGPIVTRLANLETNYDTRQCQMMFKDTFPEPPLPDTEAINTKYSGWNVTVDRLFFANGERDPWKEATVSAVGVELESTDRMPIVVSDGFHCSDLRVSNSVGDATIADVQSQALAYFATWLSEYRDEQSQYR